MDAESNVIAIGRSGTEAVTLKYASSGLPLWTVRYRGTRSRFIATDGIGNVIVAGTFTTDNGPMQHVMLKYSSSGVPLWTNQFQPPALDPVYFGYGAEFAGDAVGNLFLAGTLEGARTGYDLSGSGACK